MMDFAKLTGQPAVIDESLEAFECKPEGYENGAGEPLVLTMHPAGGTRFKKAVRKMQIKVSRSGKEAEETSGDMTEDELEAEIRAQDSRTSELLARCCDGWNMTDGKKPIPYTVDEIEAAKKATLKANNLTDAYVRAVAWRGAGEDMGVASSRNPVRLAIAVWEWGAYYGDAKMKGAKLDIAKWKRPSPETIPTAAKAAGLYMICTMSKHAAEAKGCSDALFMDYRGYVAEATGANVFFVKDGEVHTPIPDAILNGITRQTVIQMLKDKGITVIERHIMPEELADFEQCWLTGTAAEVTPVGQIGEHRFEVGDITRDIAESYEKLVRA